MIDLLELPHVEARRLAATGVPVFLTVNPVEYHGPHLSLHNDRLVSRGLARDLHARLVARGGEAASWPFVMAADLEVGVEPCPGPGSRQLSYSVVRNVVRETCRALVELGVKRVVILTFHGAPLHNLAIEAGLDVLRKAGVRAVAPFNLVMQEQLTLNPSEFAEAVKHLEEPLRTQILEGLRYDFHAGFFETSVTLHYAPQAVSPIYKSLPPCPAFANDAVTSGLHRVVPAGVFANEVGFVSRAMGWMNLRPFNAYTSRPDLATPDAGRVFAESMLDKFEAPTAASLFGSGLGTQPIMPWLRFLSLGGRVAKAPHIPLDQMRL